MRGGMGLMMVAVNLIDSNLELFKVIDFVCKLAKSVGFPIDICPERSEVTIVPGLYPDRGYFELIVLGQEDPEGAYAALYTSEYAPDDGRDGDTWFMESTVFFQEGDFSLLEDHFNKFVAFVMPQLKIDAERLGL